MFLPKWVRSLGSVNINVREDVMEAFVASLFTIADIVEGLGSGYLRSLDLMPFLYRNVTFDPETVFGRGKTQLKEWFEGLHWGEPIDEIERTKLGYVWQVYLTPAARQYLNERGFTNVPDMIGEEVSRDKGLAESNAYEKAWDTLRSYGINRKWINREKEKNEFEGRPEYAPYLEAARNRLRREGLETMKFVTPKTGAGQTSCVIQLIGFLPNGRKRVISTVNACVNQRAGKVEALRRYAMA